MKHHQHQHRSPPGTIKQPHAAAAQRDDQQHQHQTHQSKRNRHPTADRQLQWQVVGMAMPFARAQGVQHRKSGSTPAQPWAFSDQLQSHTPLTETGRGQDTLPRIAAVAEP